MEILTANLLTNGGVALAASRLDEDDRAIDVLINNARFGVTGWFTDNTSRTGAGSSEDHRPDPIDLSHAALTAMVWWGGAGHQRRFNGRPHPGRYLLGSEGVGHQFQPLGKCALGRVAKPLI